MIESCKSEADGEQQNSISDTEERCHQKSSAGGEGRWGSRLQCFVWTVRSRYSTVVKKPCTSQHKTPLSHKKKKKTQTNINWKRLTAAELANTEAESSHPNEIPLNRNWKDMYAFYISSYRQNPTLYHKRETLKFSQAIAY